MISALTELQYLRVKVWFTFACPTKRMSTSGGTDPYDKCPHRIAVLTSEGVVYFRVPYEEDVHIWWNGIRGLIRDYNYNFIKSRDTKHHKDKRWPCAIGLAECLMRGLPIGERAMASAFHCYDIDYNCLLGVGEIMIMIE